MPYYRPQPPRIDDLDKSDLGVGKHQVSYHNIGDAHAHVHP